MDYNLNSVKQVGDTMLGFGLALTIILYAVLIFSVGFYFGLILKKKYEICDLVEKIVFFISFLVVMVESWALVLMNDGFNINFNLKISLSYYLSIIIIIPIVSILVYCNKLLKKKREVKLGGIGLVGNYMILPFTILGVVMATLILFLNINYFVYYTM